MAPRVVYAGTHFIDVSNGGSFNRTLAFTITAEGAHTVQTPLPWRQ